VPRLGFSKQIWFFNNFVSEAYSLITT